MFSLLATEPDLSRFMLGASGVVSRERSGVGGWRVSELARSMTEGDFDDSLVLCFRTVKKVEDGVTGLGRSSFELPDSASKALIRCEMLDPTLPFFDCMLALDGLRVRLFRYAAPLEETLLGALPWDMSTGMRSEPRIGLDAERGRCAFFLVGLLEVGKTGVIGDLETSIDFASCTVAVCNSSINASSSNGSEGSLEDALLAGRSVLIGSTGALGLRGFGGEAREISGLFLSGKPCLGEESSATEGATVILSRTGGAGSIGTATSFLENLDFRLGVVGDVDVAGD
ncbi:hypothetical protein RRF57_007664 [Xylaria bambusicola]|uniref:Uncharacterized protein n=1 Tax=Xylaria bambusicola TaxID=326684 RepID=A0AAN7UGI3_9PEZI